MKSDLMKNLLGWGLVLFMIHRSVIDSVTNPMDSLSTPSKVKDHRVLFNHVQDLFEWVERNVQEEDRLVVLPWLWYRQWESRKDRLRDDLTKAKGFKGRERGAISIATEENGTKVYSILLSEIEGYPLSHLKGTTDVYHLTTAENALSILQTGMFLPPWRALFYKMGGGGWKDPPNEVVIVFTLPNRWLIEKDVLDTELVGSEPLEPGEVPILEATVAALDFVKDLSVQELPPQIRNILEQHNRAVLTAGVSSLKLLEDPFQPLGLHQVGSSENPLLDIEKGKFLMRIGPERINKAATLKELVDRRNSIDSQWCGFLLERLQSPSDSFPKAESRAVSADSLLQFL